MINKKSNNSKAIEVSNIHKENALLLLRQDRYYFLSDIPKLFKDIDFKAADIIKKHIMQAFLDNKLSGGLQIFCDDQEPVTIFYDAFTQKPFAKVVEYTEFYELYASNLMITIQELISVLEDLKLKEVSDNLSSILSISTKRLASKEIDEEIIKRYEALHKSNSKDNDVEIVNKLISLAKKAQDSSKNKKQRIKEEAINKKLTSKTPQYIRDIISDHYSKLITKEYEECTKRRDEQVNEIMLAVDYAEKNKFEDGLPVKIEDKLELTFSSFSAKDQYHHKQDFIRDLWKRYEAQPTREEVTAACDDKFIKKIAKKFDRDEGRVRRIVTNNIQKSNTTKS